MRQALEVAMLGRPRANPAVILSAGPEEQYLAVGPGFRERGACDRRAGRACAHRVPEPELAVGHAAADHEETDQQPTPHAARAEGM